jgi:undecaprenyl-phosphate 4-deoxy-4-formamido-L-arabinose transferase
MLGMTLSVLSGVLFLWLALRRLFLGPEVEGVFTLFALNFFFVGLALFGIGLIGEYVGRTYEQVRGRPRYLIAAVLEDQAEVAGERAEVAAERSVPLETTRV